jgi:hypothetical protein
MYIDGADALNYRKAIFALLSNDPITQLERMSISVRYGGSLDKIVKVLLIKFWDGLEAHPTFLWDGL